MVQGRAILLMACWQDVVHYLLNSAIFNNPKRPLTHISRARHYSTFNITEWHDIQR